MHLKKELDAGARAMSDLQTNLECVRMLEFACREPSGKEWGPLKWRPPQNSHSIITSPKWPIENNVP